MFENCCSVKRDEEKTLYCEGSVRGKVGWGRRGGCKHRLLGHYNRTNNRLKSWSFAI